MVKREESQSSRISVAVFVRAMLCNNPEIRSSKADLRTYICTLFQSAWIRVANNLRGLGAIQMHYIMRQTESIPAI